MTNTDTTTEIVQAKEAPTMHRTDIVGRFLDGEDFTLNNPPGFAVAATLEYMKEHDLDDLG